MTLCQDGDISGAAAENQTLTHPSDSQRSFSQSSSMVCGLPCSEQGLGKKNNKEIQKAQKEVKKISVKSACLQKERKKIDYKSPLMDQEHSLIISKKIETFEENL